MVSGSRSTFVSIRMLDSVKRSIDPRFPARVVQLTTRTHGRLALISSVPKFCFPKKLYIVGVWAQERVISFIFLERLLHVFSKSRGLFWMNSDSTWVSQQNEISLNWVSDFHSGRSGEMGFNLYAKYNVNRSLPSPTGSLNDTKGKKIRKTSLIKSTWLTEYKKKKTRVSLDRLVFSKFSSKH